MANSNGDSSSAKSRRSGYFRALAVSKRDWICRVGPGSPWLGSLWPLPNPLEILLPFLGGCQFNPGTLGKGTADTEGLIVLCQGTIPD